MLVGDVGVVQSPNYPNSYPDSTECDWDIVSTLGSNMTLIFETPFEIKNTNGQCEDSGGDYLMVSGKSSDYWQTHRRLLCPPSLSPLSKHVKTLRSS